MSHTATPEQREKAHTLDFRNNTERDAYTLGLEQRVVRLEQIVRDLERRLALHEPIGGGLIGY